MIIRLGPTNVRVAWEIRIGRRLVVAHLMIVRRAVMVFGHECRIRVPIHFRLMMAHRQWIGIFAVRFVIAGHCAAGAHRIQARLASLRVRWIPTKNGIYY